MYKFERFLVLKIAERVQLISREKCSGCVTGLVLDQLHQCMQITLKEKVARFLPRAKAEALTRLDQLFSLYHQTAWVDDDHIHLKSGEQFIDFLKAEDLLDRRYVNEDSVIEHPFNMSWLTDHDPVDTVLQTLPLVLPLDLTDTTVTTKKTSSKKRKTNV